jgi:hypothetical protein
LFDGESLFGWSEEGSAEWDVKDGAIVVESGGAGWLRSNASFADFKLHAEFKTAADGNSGIFLRSAVEGQPHVTGYELQIWDGHPQYRTGSLVNHLAAKQVTRDPGQWHRFDVEVRGERWTVHFNGEKVLEGREGKSLAGHIGLQFNPGKPIAFRNLKLQPLGLRPIFDGKTLSGWNVVDSPRPAKEKPEWTVRQGVLHVEKGPGQLETTGTYRDYVLQLEVRANSQNPNHHPNSGIFLRGEPGKYWDGYESQIRNEFKEGDRAQPVDFGTGGIYRKVPTRRVVSSDNEFFTKTIQIRNRHIAVWVNGELVSDWEDPDPEGKDVRKGEARLTPGTISLQAHDPTTNLDFRNIRLAEFPPSPASATDSGSAR